MSVPPLMPDLAYSVLAHLGVATVPPRLPLFEAYTRTVFEGGGWASLALSRRERPLHLETFPGGQQIDHPLNGDVAKAVAEHFDMDVATVRTALAATKLLPAEAAHASQAVTVERPFPSI